MSRLHGLTAANWIEPHRSAEVAHWTKPPLTYWAIAGSVAASGHNAWAARLPAALSYLLCVWLAWKIARRRRPAANNRPLAAVRDVSVPDRRRAVHQHRLRARSLRTLAMWGFIEARFGTHPFRTLVVADVGGFGAGLP